MNLCDLPWVLTPGSQCGWRVFERNAFTYDFVDWEGNTFEVSDHGFKILWHGIARATDVELLHDEELGFVCDGSFCIADVDDASREADFFDTGFEGSWQSYSFDHDSWAFAVGHFLKTIV